ncbi:MAG: hypothetical protein Q9202_005042 [Teloschistes flavicans]
MVMAGSDTSSHTLVVAVFNLLHNKLDFLTHVKRELCGVIHDKDQIVQWEVLEKLPYMRATIKESLRLSYGAPGRLPRVVPKDTILCDTYIKAGVSWLSQTFNVTEG